MIKNTRANVLSILLADLFKSDELHDKFSR